MAHGSEDAVVPPVSPFPYVRSSGVGFNYNEKNWDGVPDKTWATFSPAFKMESVKEVELESAFGFPVALLVSLATLKYLALSNVDLDADEEIYSTSPCEVAL